MSQPQAGCWRRPRHAALPARPPPTALSLCPVCPFTAAAFQSTPRSLEGAISRPLPTIGRFPSSASPKRRPVLAAVHCRCFLRAPGGRAAQLVPAQDAPPNGRPPPARPTCRTVACPPAGSSSPLSRHGLPHALQCALMWAALLVALVSALAASARCVRHGACCRPGDRPSCRCGRDPWLSAAPDSALCCTLNAERKCCLGTSDGAGCQACMGECSGCASGCPLGVLVPNVLIPHAWSGLSSEDQSVG